MKSYILNSRYLYLLSTLVLTFFPMSLFADALDSLHTLMSDKAQVQEKVYVQTDNNCYFVGDTLWYKAFVLRADNHTPTNMSKMLYVELLSPDGVVVERQRIVVSNNGVSCGQFALQDSLYSGYYEIRAYTRWMLNFNVSHRHYTRDDKHMFYRNSMAEDFFREWDGLYSRVIPVFSKPVTNGDYSGKYMYGRPKQEMEFVEKPKLLVNFYPEGGHLVAGVKNRIAFSITDNNGEALNISGTLSDGTKLSPRYMGRGVVSVVPNGQKATFKWNGTEWTFSLPKTEDQGVALELNHHTATWRTRGCQVAAYAVTCRGKLHLFERVSAQSVSIDTEKLPAGVNELLLLDADAKVLASRLFFVNHTDVAKRLSVSTDKTIYKPYEEIRLSVAGAEPKVPFAISVRDARTDDTSYDDGDIMTEMLLCSDLKGFVASPAYYFEKDDDAHASALDELLMVQGWRRYARVPMLRYRPETTLTYEGMVNKQLGVDILTIDDVPALDNLESVADNAIKTAENAVSEGGVTMSGESATPNTDTDGDNAKAADEAAKSNSSTTDVDANDDTNVEGAYLGVNHGSLKKEVLVEAELSKDGQTVGAVQQTKNGGRFLFQLPPYYGKAVLFVKAYNMKDSLKKSMETGMDKHRMDEESYPDFYITQDKFFPVFAHPYSWYQTHQPEWRNLMIDDALTQADSKLDGDHTLSTVKVDAKRRSRRAVDFSKPAYVVDAYDLYNEATDRGLSWGVANMGTFPKVASFTVYGNMNRYRKYNIRAAFDDGYIFYQDFRGHIGNLKNRSNALVFDNLHLKRINKFKFYTDYEPRNPDDRHTEGLNTEDVTMVYDLIPDNGTRYTYRDRRYIFDGFAEPETFYTPDYSKTRLEMPRDFRRTLYWNPNAIADENGNFSVTLYNNSRETMVKTSVAGVTNDGKFMVK